MKRWIGAVVLPVLFGLSACCNTCDDDYYYYAPPPEPRPVEMEVEVYDPVSGGVWENVGVRIVQADQEWNSCTCVSPLVDEFELTSVNGLVYFSPYALAFYDVGFALDSAGKAVLGPDLENDEASVLIEVFADGFDSVFAQVDLSWEQPYAFVSVPFRAPVGPRSAALGDSVLPTLRW